MNGPEDHAGSTLREALCRAQVGGALEMDSNFRDLMSYLEMFVPWVLGQVHDWEEALDGVMPWSSLKTGDREALLVGKCILMDDQTESPIYVKIRHSAAVDEIEWLECGLGVPGPGKSGLLRLPINSAHTHRLANLISEDLQAVDWVFRATYGECTP